MDGDAKLVLPSRRLRMLALDVMRRHGEDMPTARDALLSAVQSDAQLLWEMLGKHRDWIAVELLNAIRREASEGAGGSMPETAGEGMPPRTQSAGNGGASGPRGDANNGQRVDARSDTSEGAGAICCVPETAGVDVPPPPSGASVIPVRAHWRGLPERVTAARHTGGMAAVGAVAAASLLDTFRVNGQAIGDLTAREAVQWAGSRERDARFVRLLVENLPPDLPIRRFRTADEAAELYARARDEQNA